MAETTVRVRYRRALIPAGDLSESVETARADLLVAVAVIANLLKGTDAEREFVNVYMNLLTLMQTFEDAVVAKGESLASPTVEQADTEQGGV